MTERPEERDSLNAFEEGLRDPMKDRIAALEAEVKELREELNAATAPYPEAFEAGRQAAARIKQMEEALRRVELISRAAPGSTWQSVNDIALAALSPSDTEE